MYYEMQEQFLHTVLIPAPDPMHTGHMIRVVDNTNPDWYRELCANNLSTCKSHRNRTKIDTKIKRQSVLQFLLDPQKHQRFKYGEQLINIAKKRLEDIKNDTNIDEVPF